MSNDLEVTEYQHIYEKLDERITFLQSQWSYYSKPRKISCSFSNDAHVWYKSIPTRLLELEYILKNIL